MSTTKDLANSEVAPVVDDSGDDDTLAMFRVSVRAFIEREVKPHYEDWERAGRIDKTVFRAAGQAGFLGLGAPESYGGSPADYRFNAAVAEEFCAAGVLNAVLGLTVHTDVVLPYIVRLGTPEQKKRWLPALCDGSLVGTIAMTEPGTGSDLSAIATHATKTASGYVLNGAKLFISNGQNADLVLTVCRTGDPSARHRNLSILAVDATSKGFSRGRNLEKVGQHAADTSELHFDDVEVPAENLLGAEGAAFDYLVRNLPQERLSVAVTAIAHAEAAFGWTLDYCKQRHAFGQPIGSFQNSRFALATMRTELDIARIYIQSLLHEHIADQLSAEDSAQAKWWCSELNSRVLDTCLQLHGAYGYMEEYPIARAWRDGRVMSIYGGTNEIMKELVGRRKLGV